MYMDSVVGRARWQTPLSNVLLRLERDVRRGLLGLDYARVARRVWKTLSITICKPISESV